MIKFSNPNELAYNNPEFMLSLYGLLSEVSGQENQGKFKNALLQKAMKRKSATIREVIEGFWGAYSDPYVKDGNIEWRHICKHIDIYRENRPAKYIPKNYYKG